LVILKKKYIILEPAKQFKWGNALVWDGGSFTCRRKSTQGRKGRYKDLKQSSYVDGKTWFEESLNCSMDERGKGQKQTNLSKQKQVAGYFIDLGKSIIVLCGGYGS
jgi:hypothetical protein